MSPTDDVMQSYDCRQFLYNLPIDVDAVRRFLHLRCRHHHQRETRAGGGGGGNEGLGFAPVSANDRDRGVFSSKTETDIG